MNESKIVIGKSEFSMRGFLASIIVVGVLILAVIELCTTGEGMMLAVVKELGVIACAAYFAQKGMKA